MIRIVGAALSVVVSLCVTWSTASAQESPIRIDRRVIVLPTAEGEFKEAHKCVVSVGDQIVMHVFYPLGEEASVQADVGPKGTFQTVGFRRVVVFDPNGVPFPAERGDSALLLEAKQPGKGTVKISVGQRVYSYQVEVKR